MPTTFVITFFAKKNDPAVWPEAWQVNASGTLDGAFIASKDAIENVFPKAERFEIKNMSGELCASWPETH